MRSVEIDSAKVQKAHTLIRILSRKFPYLFFCIQKLNLVAKNVCYKINLENLLKK